MFTRFRIMQRRTMITDCLRLTRKFSGGNSKNEGGSWTWPSGWPSVSTIVLCTGTILLNCGVYNYANVKEASKNNLKFLLKDSLKESQLTYPQENKEKYVAREKIHQSITEYIDSRTDGYAIVYGPKGAGKSETVNSVLSGKKGVIHLDVTNNSTTTNLLEMITEKLNCTRADNKPLLEEDFVDAIRSSGGTPIIVFDVERSSGGTNILQNVRSLAKRLSTVARVIIITAEANAVLEFGYDLDRETFIFVGELSRDEAKSLLQQSKHSFTDDDMSKIFATIGTLALTLQNLSAKVPHVSLEQFMNTKLTEASHDLENFKHQQIVQALKESPYGVQTKSLVGLYNNGVHLSDEREVGVAMKLSNAIIYHPTNKSYELMSTAHRTAIKSYKPRSKSSLTFSSRLY